MFEKVVVPCGSNETGLLRQIDVELAAFFNASVVETRGGKTCINDFDCTGLQTAAANVTRVIDGSVTSEAGRRDVLSTFVTEAHNILNHYDTRFLLDGCYVLGRNNTHFKLDGILYTAGLVQKGLQAK